MSVCLDFGDDRDDQPSVQVATNRGWSDVLDWAAEHEPDAYPALFGLLQHGVSEELAAIVEEIEGVLDRDRPDSDVADTLGTIADAVADHVDDGIAVVSSQFQSGSIEGDDDDADDEADDDDA